MPSFKKEGDKLLENIKLILGLDKDDYNNLIILFISKVTKRVEGYCNIEDIYELEENEQEALLEFIEDKVCNIMAYKLSQAGEKVDSSTTVTPENQGAIKSITRGSVRIEYNYDSVTADSSGGASETKRSPELTDDEKEYLNQFRRCRFY